MGCLSAGAGASGDVMSHEPFQVVGQATRPWLTYQVNLPGFGAVWTHPGHQAGVQMTEAPTPGPSCLEIPK